MVIFLFCHFEFLWNLYVYCVFWKRKTLCNNPLGSLYRHLTVKKYIFLIIGIIRTINPLQNLILCYIKWIEETQACVKVWICCKIEGGDMYKQFLYISENLRYTLSRPFFGIHTLYYTNKSYFFATQQQWIPTIYMTGYILNTCI